MTESLMTAQSILWMLRKVMTNGGFRYEDWKSKFREDDMGKELRGDRRFFNHLSLFNVEVITMFPEMSGYKLKGSMERYFLHRTLSEVELGKMNDKNLTNFMPLLHALNADRSLIPFPDNAIEKQLLKGLDIDSDTLGRIIYKHTFPWRFRPDFLNAFLDALHQKTKLFIRPEGDRKPCSITPLFLINYEGAWHLLGLYADIILQYPLSRVLEVSVTDQPADALPAKRMQALKSLVQKSFGINLIVDWEKLSEGENVTVRYSGHALRYAKERYDPEQRQDSDPWFEASDMGDYVDVTVKAHTPWEILSEVLRWGQDAEAVQPVEFRNQWIQKIREMYAKVEHLN